MKKTTTMHTVAIITRRLKEGKTYDDFRKAWYHTVGFGTSSKLYTVINANDPREIIVIGFVEMSIEKTPSTLRIDVRERLDRSLDDIIEPGIGRQFGLLVSEDDFSADGAIDYKPASVAGKETNFDDVSSNLSEIAKAIAQASKERNEAKKARDRSISQKDIKQS
jgi:hypothetical protein